MQGPYWASVSFAHGVQNGVSGITFRRFMAIMQPQLVQIPYWSSAIRFSAKSIRVMSFCECDNACSPPSFKIFDFVSFRTKSQRRWALIKFSVSTIISQRTIVNVMIPYKMQHVKPHHPPITLILPYQKKHILIYLEHRAVSSAGRAEIVWDTISEGCR